MDFIYRLSGREAADLQKEIVKTQNILNEKITEVDSLETLNKKYLEKITSLEKDVKYYQNTEAAQDHQIKLLKKSKNEALAAVSDANAKLADAETQFFNISQELAQRNSDFNDMILKVSQLEHKLKDISTVVPKTAFGEKIQNIKKRHTTKK